MLKTCGFKVVVLIAFAVLLIITLINAFYFFRLKNSKSLGAFEIQSMYWISIILSVILAFLLAWSIYQAVVTCGVDKKAKEIYNTYEEGRRIRNLPPPPPPPIE